MTVSSVPSKEKLFSFILLSPKTQFLSTHHCPGNCIPLAWLNSVFCSYQMGMFIVHGDVSEDAPVYKATRHYLVFNFPTQTSWLCASHSRCVALCAHLHLSPWCTAPLEEMETRHFPAFPAAIHSADNQTTVQLLILFMEITIKRGTLLKHSHTDACLC